MLQQPSDDRASRSVSSCRTGQDGGDHEPLRWFVQARPLLLRQSQRKAFVMQAEALEQALQLPDPMAATLKSD